MMSENSAFDQTLKAYLEEIRKCDISRKTEALGVDVSGDDIIIRFYDRQYRVRYSRVLDARGNDVIHAIRVILCRYLLMAPETTPFGSDWVAYKDFVDAAPFTGAFSEHAEHAIARNFSGRLESLIAAAKKMGGQVTKMDLAYDATIIFQCLPRVPVLLLFNDADEDFGARALILFERRAVRYLDVECLAMAGWLLSDELAVVSGGKQSGIR
jgi:hypothetical protein